MNMAKLHSAVQQYNKVGVSSGVESASPHRLIQMLMVGALEKINTAKGHMKRGEVSPKGGNISWAISIIDGLRASLDLDTGGEIAQNLDDLYDYMTRRLARANVENDADILDEVASLLRSIKSSWDEVPAQIEREKQGQV
ncbi:Flagellar biosynthesis protein FliS [hydrothermal vent metagenome]|uniref:Flagellar biosynthesis protein FliS n=1 Tax=hydrothermal vent metagenome TaxID=652676 RepID=A0A3B1AX37_9ZZZZ